MSKAGERETVAAVDLGSNSFHLLIAHVVDGELHPVDRLREWVQLAGGLDEKSRLTKPARERALACLSRFGQRLRDLPEGRVRAVGTNTLRKAKNAEEFLLEAREALGHPIKIVSGEEEARLIYLGVSQRVFDDETPRLVVDIGGGSTECILGTGFEPQRAESLYMGSLSYTKSFFPEGVITEKAMRDAELAARLEMQNIERPFRELGWQQSVGASGTILAFGEILQAMGWAKRGVTLAGLRKVRKALLKAGRIDAIELSGVRDDRAAVLPGGLAILVAIFESLGIEEMVLSSGAIREGLLYDLLGRMQSRDTRDRTIHILEERYRIDRTHARRVEEGALSLLERVAESWGLDRKIAERYLRWAARLHEIGLAISHSGFHKHGAYIVTHSVMPGFSVGGKKTLAALILAHRRKFGAQLFETLPSRRAERTFRLAVVLRLAVLLNRSRSQAALPRLSVSARKRSLALGFPSGWLDEHPLTRVDLEREAKILAGAGIRLAFE